ncbi:MAG TPA: DUF3971 domain-containing protein [Alphaproteobacteria bacterium]
MTDEVKTQSPENDQDIKIRRWVRPLCIGLIILTAVTIGAGALCWRLAQGPFHADFMVPFLEKSLSEDDGLQFNIGDLNMVWRGGNTPLGFEITDMSVAGSRGNFMTISHADVGISPLYLLLGQLHIAHANIHDLDLRIIRLPDGKVTLTGSDAESEDKPKTETIGLTLKEIARKLPAIDTMTLKDTMIVFEDQRDAIVRRFEDVQVEMTQSGRFSKRSFSGYITAPLSGMENDTNSNAALDFVYNADDELLTVAASVDRANTRRLIGPWLRQANLPRVDMQVEGRAQFQLNNDFTLYALNFNLKGSDGMLIWPRSYGEGLENQKLTDFNVEIAFDPVSQALELKNASLTSKGLTIVTSGSLKITDNWQKLDGFIDVKIPVVAVDLLPAIWPKVWDGGARHWLVEKMDKGRFSKMDVHVPLSAHMEDAPVDEALEEDDSGRRWIFENGTIKGTFGFTGITVDYRPPMIPSSNTTGTGVFEGLALTLDIDKASIGNLAVSDGSLYFDDLITAGAGNAKLHFEMTGPVKAVFDYLEREPISYRKKVDLDMSKAGGNAAMVVDVDFPTLKDMPMDAVHVGAKADLTNLNVPNAVKGMTLAGGPYVLEASENHFKISGSGTLDGQPAKVMWHELFAASPKDAFASKLEADLQTNKAMRSQFIGQSLEGRVDDSVIPAVVSMTTLPSGKSNLKVSANLTGARVDLTNPFNTVKEPGKSARADLTATLQNNEIQSIDTLTIKGDGMSLDSGSIDFARDKAGMPILSKAILKNLNLGQNNADINAVWPTEYEIKADVSGDSFDARWIMGDDEEVKSGDAPPAPGLSYDVALKLNKLYISDVPLEKVSGAFIGNTKGKQQMANLDATAGGPVSLRYRPGDRLLLDLADAGTGLQALGITERVRGGSLHAEAAPIPNADPGDMQGKLVLKDFSVHKAPMLAKLINILSIPGLLSILNQDTGLSFQRAEADMIWLNRDGGGTLQFKDGRTSGASLGLTFEGEVNTASDQMAIQGTVIPMSEVNGLLSSIPLIGDILTGGKSGSGIFAATYTMKGNTADPSVSVNPLSVLTPGILRRILFESGTPKASDTPSNDTPKMAKPRGKLN